jgi:hypothetical protein
MERITNGLFPSVVNFRCVGHRTVQRKENMDSTEPNTPFELRVPPARLSGESTPYTSTSCSGVHMIRSIVYGGCRQEVTVSRMGAV